MKTYSILIIDDEPLLRQTMKNELTREGFLVSTAADGENGLQQFESGSFDSVITDLTLPGINGIQVLNRIKEANSNTPVMIITAYGDMSSAISALQSGADDYLLKPFEYSELKLRLEKCLQKRELAMNLEESERRLRMALDATSEGVWDRNLETGEVYYGENWARLLGYTSKEVVENNLRFDNLIHPEDKQKTLALIQEHLDGKTERYRAEFRLRTSANGWQWILAKGQVVTKDENGRPIRFIGTHTDINDRKKAELVLQESHKWLEHEVDLRTSETNRQRDSLQKVNDALTVLLDKRDLDKKNLKEQMVANLRVLVEPYIEKLKRSSLNEKQQVYLNILETNLNDLVSPFLRELSSKYLNFTPTEVQVANLIKSGKTTKEIAKIMNLSPETICNHRKHIRKKTGIRNKKVNLRTTLSSFSGLE